VELQVVAVEPQVVAAELRVVAVEASEVRAVLAWIPTESESPDGRTR
jgi:tripartite-type tricarboxylate transporter receptor subunit TctC